jgi:hypothetical protein
VPAWRGLDEARVRREVQRIVGQPDARRRLGGGVVPAAHEPGEVEVGGGGGEEEQEQEEGGGGEGHPEGGKRAKKYYCIILKIPMQSQPHRGIKVHFRPLQPNHKINTINLNA